MNKNFRIAHFMVGKDHKPFIVAEMSGNHNQSLDRALAIVDAAAAAGAHALKIQTYTADTMTLNLKRDEFLIKDPKSLWNNRSLYDLYEEAHTPWAWHEPIFDRCKKYGMIGFSAPFDETAVDFLESLNVPCYKVASFEMTDLPLIQKIAATKKPIIISTGMANEKEISEAVRAAKNAGCENLILLKCTSTYPATPENTNLVTIPHMKKLYGCPIGLSDHTMGIGCSVASVALGAVMIEKHFTLKRSDGGVDSAFSLEPEEMKSLVIESERAFLGLGKIQQGPQAAEKPSLQFRRSLYIAKDMKAGEVFTKANLRKIRPGFGLAPKFYNDLLGKKVTKDVVMGTPVSSDLVDTPLADESKF
ncbi:MAG: pseudaminic acid synthase [Deltaproteobacteria bacterium]|nr:pseudaminic acid synthase [Deltaproteobacteria bacterium]